MTANIVSVTEGSGKNVATETVGSTDFQRIEVVGLGGASVLSVDANGAAKVAASITGTVPVTQGGIFTISGSVLTLRAPVASLVSGVTSVVTSTSQTSVLATAPGAQRNYITHVLVTNAAATGAFVDLMDGPNVIYSGYAAASGGGFSASFPVPLKQTNLATSIDMKASAQASIKTAITGYTGA
jgi:hypothetical protein